MSIVRWCKQADGIVSDVYIYYDCHGGITCHSSINDELDFNLKTEKEVLKHLQDNFKDHHIPQFVFEYLSKKSTGDTND